MNFSRNAQLNKLAEKRAGEDRLFNFRPVLFFAIFLCLGIVVGGYILTGVSPLWLLVVLPVLSFPFFFCQSKAQVGRVLTVLCTLLLGFLVGVFSFTLQTDSFSQGVCEGEYFVSGRVVDCYETDNNFVVELDSLRIGETKTRGKLVAYLPMSIGDSITLSDKVLIYGKVQNTERVYEGKINAYKIANNHRFRLDGEECSVVGSATNPFLFVRERIENAVRRGMDETPASVTLAVLLGDTSLIDEGLLENVRRGGIAHIFAVSGLHVGALYGFCLWLFKRERLQKTPKWLQFVLTFLLLVFYGGVCGYSSSVVRAIVMCLTLGAFNLLGLHRDLLESIGFAGIIVLLLSPASLFTIGFQLSFVACIGIALFSRPISKGFAWIGDKISNLYYGKVELPEGMKEDSHPLSVAGRIWRACGSFLSVTISAQIFTAPLQLYAFGYISGWSVLLNCLFVPIVSVLFSVLLLFVVVASICPLAFSVAILYAPSVVWSTLLLVFEIADFSSFAIEGIALNFGAFVCYYGAFLFCTDKWNMKKGTRIFLIVLLFVAFAVTVFALNR